MIFLPLFLFSHLFLLASTKFTLWPEMVVYPYLLNNNFQLYKDIVMPYPPLFIEALSAFSKFFGYDPFPYQVLSWIIILATDLLIYFIAKKIAKSNLSSLSSLSFFIFFSIPFGVNSLWFDLIQTPLILLSFYFFLVYTKARNQKSIFLSYIFLTVAFFIKQQAIWLFIFYTIFLLVKFRKDKMVLNDLVVAFLPFLIGIVLLFGYLSSKNILRDGVFWSLYFPFYLSSKMPGYLSLPTIKQAVIVISLFLFFTPTISKKNYASLAVLTSLILLTFSLPRFDYFHLISSLALLSLAVTENIKILKKYTYGLYLLALLLITPIIFTLTYFKNNWSTEVRFFEEAIYTEASLVKNVTQKDKPIYIQNGPDQIYPLSQRLPIKPWADEFSWYLEVEGMQQKVISAIQNQNPQFVIYKPYGKGTKYALSVYKPEKISKYLEENYSDLLQLSPILWLKVKNE